MSFVRVLVCTVVVVAIAAWPSVPSVAHTTAVASWPAQGELATTAPDRVTILFTGELLPDVRMDVIGPDGSSVSAGDPVVLGKMVTQAIEPSSETAGPYTAFVTVISEDMHPIEGRIDFVVDPDGVATGNPAGPPPDLGLDDEEPDEARPAAEDDDGADGTMPLLLTGLVGAALLVVVLRLVVRRRRG